MHPNRLQRALPRASAIGGLLQTAQLARSSVLLPTLVLCSGIVGCQSELGSADSGFSDAGVEPPVPVAPAAEPALDADLGVTPGNDAMASTVDATWVAHTADSGASPLDAQLGDAGPVDAQAPSHDATASHAVGPDASASDADQTIVGEGGALSAITTRFEETGRVCHGFAPWLKLSQRTFCQTELCGPAQVQLELAGAGVEFEVSECKAYDPPIPTNDWPLSLRLSSAELSLHVVFDGAIRVLPLTRENLQAHVMWGEFTYSGAHTNQPPSAAQSVPFDFSDRVPVEIVDYRDGMLHLKLEYAHTALAYSEHSDGYPCEAKTAPYPTICTELYCNYVPGEGAGADARTAKFDAIARVRGPLCP